MAVYTSETLVDNELGSHLVDELLDLDEDGGDDSPTLAQRITNVTSMVDGIIGARYEVQLDDINGTPATPELIQTAATYLLAADLLSSRAELATQRDDYEARGMKILESIRDSLMVIPGLAPLASPNALTDGFGYSDDTGAEPTFAGVDDCGDDRMQGW